MRMSRILIAGGGTAGHVVPALALADVLSARGHEVAFCGTGRGMEKDLVPRAGYPFSVVRIRGFSAGWACPPCAPWRRSPWPGWTPGGCCAPSDPAAWSAWARTPRGRWWPRRRSGGIPTVAVEMDAHMGWTNRILSLLVDRVCLSFPRPGADGRQVRVHGPPSAPRLLAATREEGLARFDLDPGRPVLLVFGGSLGAHTLNEATLAAFATARHALPDPPRHRGAGVRRASPRRWTRRTPTRPTRPSPFWTTFPWRLAAADVVVARAGGSVAEILARGVPSLLVPYPLAAGDHQTKNARMVAAAGRRARDRRRRSRPRSAWPRRWTTSSTRRRTGSMRAAALRLAGPDAADRIADVIVELVAAEHRKKGP